jgi:hypothetical protein
MFTTNAKVNYMKNKTYAKIENKNDLELTYYGTSRYT